MTRNQTKSVSQRRDQFLAAWREYATEASFSGIDLATFEADTTVLPERQKDLDGLQMKMSGAKLARDQAEQVVNDVMVKIAQAIRGSEAYGEDCPFYRALGFIPKSERKSGRPRKPPEAPASADAA